MVNDNDLVSLRKDKKYQALLAQVRDRQPISVLKKSAPYAKDDAKIEFRYQPKESNNLCKVRDYFKLDSVAGQGDELSKIINLLHLGDGRERHDAQYRRGTRTAHQRPALGALRDGQLESRVAADEGILLGDLQPRGILGETIKL